MTKFKLLRENIFAPHALWTTFHRTDFMCVCVFIIFMIAFSVVMGWFLKQNRVRLNWSWWYYGNLRYIYQ